MTPIRFCRGYNSTFYFAQEVGDSDCCVFEMKFHYSSQKWQPNLVEVLKINEGTVIAMEMDPDNREKTDSIYTYAYTFVYD